MRPLVLQAPSLVAVAPTAHSLALDQRCHPPGRASIHQRSLTARGHQLAGSRESGAASTIRRGKDAPPRRTLHFREPRPPSSSSILTQPEGVVKGAGPGLAARPQPAQGAAGIPMCGHRAAGQAGKAASTGASIQAARALRNPRPLWYPRAPRAHAGGWRLLLMRARQATTPRLLAQGPSPVVPTPAPARARAHASLARPRPLAQGPQLLARAAHTRTRAGTPAPGHPHGGARGVEWWGSPLG